VPTKTAKILLAAAAVSFLFFIAWFSLELHRPFPSEPRRVVVEVTKGQSVSDIARRLKQEGILRKTWPFLLGYKLFYSSESLKAGEYRFQLPLTAKEVLHILSEGSVLLHSVTVPEGMTMEETAELLESEGFADKEAFLGAARNVSLIADLDPEAEDLEGYLFPETYRFPKGATAEEIVRTMVFQFREVFPPEKRRLAAEAGLTVRETVILASLIEKETSLAREKPLVSAVFHNRLARGMKLDCDPTVIYALKKMEKYRGRLWIKDLKVDSPYNTYLYGGLPPGPIANPGRASLDAALHPAEADYLYFVSKNDGSHHFSRTFGEHLRAVNLYRRK